MLNSVIVDDEITNTDHLSLMIKRSASNVKILGSADTVESGVSLIKEKKPNLLFLDIKLHEGTSFEILEKTADMDYEVVFVTAYDEYAIQAVRASALDYIMKPIDPEQLKEAINKCRIRVEEKLDQEIRNKFFQENLINYSPNQQIAFPTFDGLCFFRLNEIVKFVADGSYTEAHFTGGRKLLLSKNLRELEKAMLGKGFNRIHKSFLINLGHISEYKKGGGGIIKMSDGTTVYVSKRKREAFLSLFRNQIIATA